MQYKSELSIFQFFERKKFPDQVVLDESNIFDHKNQYW